MRTRLAAVVAAAVLIVAAVTAGALLLGSEDDDDGSGARVAGEAARQLSYLPPDASAVFVVDLRYEERNWSRLRTVAARVLREYRSAEGEDGVPVPPNLTGLLNSLTGFAGLSFEDDVQPVLDGYLAVSVAVPPRRPLPEKLARIGELIRDGASPGPGRRGYVRYDGPPRPGGAPPRPRLLRERDGTPITAAEGRLYFEAVRRQEDASEPRTVVTYRTPRGGLRKIVDKVFEGDSPKRLEGFDDVRLLDDASALVGDDTLVLAIGGEGDSPARARGAGPGLRRALERARSGRGFPAARLEQARRRSGSSDPFILATGDLTLGRLIAEEPSFRRARRAVRWLSAIRSMAAAVDLEPDRAVATARIGTDAARLKASDLPVGPAGQVELPVTPLLAGASRDQSVTTSFAARVARELFADSRFVRAVERAERDLGIRFEDEVLRQFDCPSISVFDVRRTSFGARSCLRDPAAMRRLLPRLAPHLPRIVTALQALGDEGLFALLLVAPDAPLTPTLPLGAITVKPPAAGNAGGPESLYEITGLRDGPGRAARAGPERVVFGMIGDRFVVASDRPMARRVARLRTRARDARAASTTRVPGGQLVGGTRQSAEAVAFARVLRELVVDVAADRSALTARAELTFGD